MLKLLTRLFLFNKGHFWATIGKNFIVVHKPELKQVEARLFGESGVMVVTADDEDYTAGDLNFNSAFIIYTTMLKKDVDYGNRRKIS